MSCVRASSQQAGLAAADQLLGEDARGVRQRVVGAGLDGFDRGSGVEVVEVGAGQLLAVLGVHCVAGVFAVMAWA
jgi:hypothetical protein